MNLESENYEGELRELRAREKKLAVICSAVEELLDNGPISDHPGAPLIRDPHDVDRLISDPEISNWLGRMRNEGFAPIRRFPCHADP